MVRQFCSCSDAGTILPADTVCKPTTGCVDFFKELRKSIFILFIDSIDPFAVEICVEDRLGVYIKLKRSLIITVKPKITRFVLLYTKPVHSRILCFDYSSLGINHRVGVSLVVGVTTTGDRSMLGWSVLLKW